LTVETSKVRIDYLLLWEDNSVLAIIEAKEAVDKAGAKVVKAIVIVDRGEGAKANLAKAGLKLESIFTIEELDI